MILIGKNLGERQKDFNKRVDNAVAKKVKFELIEAQEEESDIDVFFKIDVAARYKNTEYILKILKSEDVLHIERALKMCDWLYNEEYSYIVNTDYLHNNVFPHMSMKMKRKMLNTIALHIRDKSRAELFYNYCKKENYKHSSYKFLIHTSEAFKLECINRETLCAENFFQNGNLKLLVGNSQILAEAYLKLKSYYSINCLVKRNCLYFLSNENYLATFEKNYGFDDVYEDNAKIYKLSKKVSEDIAIKYKSRILMKPEIYLPRLDMKTLVKHSSLEEIKQYAIAKLPNTAEKFWAGKYWKTYKLILNAIPPKTKFEFIKTIFTNKFPGKEFETSEEFYTSGTFNLMTKEQKIETTKNFDDENGKTSRVKRCIWYKSVPFETAFTTFKKVMVTNTNRKVRSNLLVVLIKASKTQQDLDRILNYYYSIFKSEKPTGKEKFLNALFVHRREEIFDKDFNSWTILEKMLLDEGASKCLNKYKATVYLCYILHNMEPPEELKTCLDTADPASLNGDITILEDKQKDMAYEHLSKYHENKLYELEGKTSDLDNKVNQVRQHVHSYINLISRTNKSVRVIPENVRKYVLTHWKQFRHIDVCKDIKNDHFNFTHRLKQDLSEVTDFRLMKEYFKNNSQFKLKPFLERIKIYFAHDIAKDFVTFFRECLSPNYHERFDVRLNCDRSTIDTAVISIFMLAEESYKREMILKYTPEADGKIDYIEMDGLHLCIQESICRYAYILRSRLPVSVFNGYFRGDYVKRCLPTISSLFANLTANSCLELAHTLASAPKSSQRFTFPILLAHLTNAHVEKLKEIVLCFWRTGNKLVRRNVFESIRNNIEFGRQDETQFFFMMIEMVSTLREDDDSNFFEFIGDFHEQHDVWPNDLKGDYLEAAWRTVGKFRGFTFLKTCLIICIDDNISLISNEIVINIINEHIQNAPEFGVEELEKAKWELAASYLVVQGDDTTHYLLDNIMTKLIHYIHTLRQFTSKLLDACMTKKRQSYSQTDSLLLKMLSYLTGIDSLDLKYTMIWDLKLAIISNKIMDLARSKLNGTDVDYEIIAKEIESNFAKALGKFVTELVNKNQYLEYFVPQISEKIREVSTTMCFYLDFKFKVHYFSLIVFLIDGLINFDSSTIQLLALNILISNIPENFGKSIDHYRALFDRLKDIEDGKIQAFLNKNFSNNGIKRRRLNSTDSDYSDDNLFHF